MKKRCKNRGMYHRHGLLAKAGKLMRLGMSNREVAKIVGSTKTTMSKLRVIAEADNGGPFLCGCGKPATHNGWCKARFERSLRRQAFVKIKWPFKKNQFGRGGLPETAIEILVELYRIMRSCQKVACSVGMTRQAVWDILNRRGLINAEDFHQARLKEYVEYRGLKFTRDKDGYFRPTTAESRKKGGCGKKLHHLIFIDNHGPIPEGCIVYFKDGNKDNLHPDNIGACTRFEHRKMCWKGNGSTKYKARKQELFNRWMEAMKNGDQNGADLAKRAYDSLPVLKLNSGPAASERQRKRWASYTQERKREIGNNVWLARHGKQLEDAA